VRSFSSGGSLKGAVVREEQWRGGLSVSGSIGARAGAAAMASSGAPSAPLTAYGGPRRRGSQGDGELEVRGDSELEVDLTTPTDFAARAMAAALPPALILLRAGPGASSPLPSSAGGGSSSSLHPLPAAGAEQQQPHVGPTTRPSRASAFPGDTKENRGALGFSRLSGGDHYGGGGR
jgi:hypothetical protein